jgi:hypothetical protein
VGSAILTFVSVVGTCDVREVLWKQGAKSSAAFRRELEAARSGSFFFVSRLK